MEEELFRLIQLDNEKKLIEYLNKNRELIDWKKVIIDETKPLNSNGYYILGRKYLGGFGVKIDYQKAFYYCELSAKRGHSGAICNLGFMYMKGLGIKKDYRKALSYFKLSAKQNNASAQNNLGWMYLNGFGIEKDYGKAIYYFELSIKQNFPKAQNNLGCIYLGGLGVEKDYQKALYYFELSAKQNDPSAQYYLGCIYKKGLGVEKDIKKALYYFVLSAKRDNQDAINEFKAILRNEENYLDIIEYIYQSFKLKNENSTLLEKIKKMKIELDCIPERGDVYFKAKKHFEDHKN